MSSPSAVIYLHKKKKKRILVKAERGSNIRWSGSVLWLDRSSKWKQTVSQSYEEQVAGHFLEGWRPLIGRTQNWSNWCWASFTHSEWRLWWHHSLTCSERSKVVIQFSVSFLWRARLIGAAFRCGHDEPMRSETDFENAECHRRVLLRLKIKDVETFLITRFKSIKVSLIWIHSFFWSFVWIWNFIQTVSPEQGRRAQSDSSVQSHYCIQ